MISCVSIVSFEHGYSKGSTQTATILLDEDCPHNRINELISLGCDFRTTFSHVSGMIGLQPILAMPMVKLDQQLVNRVGIPATFHGGLARTNTGRHVKSKHPSRTSPYARFSPHNTC